MSASAAETSAAASGWSAVAAAPTVSPCVAASAIAPRNSKNCVARRIVYGSPDCSISRSCAIFARM